MGKRKIILLCLAVFLLAVYAFQIASSRKNTVRQLTLSEDISTITLSCKENGEITLTKNADGWKVGKYTANESKASQIAEQIKSIKILDTVSSSANDASLYGLDEANVITVKAWAGEQLLRTMEIGKASVTGSQTYIRLDGEKAVGLASGSLAALFSSTAEQLRDNSIYSFASADIEKVVSRSSAGNFAVMRLPAASEDGAAEWALLTESGEIDTEQSVDSAKVASWVSSIAILNASDWTDESDTTPLDAQTTLEITAKGKTISVNIAAKGADDTYTAECSESPYRFKITQYAGGNLSKTLEELKAQ